MTGGMFGATGTIGWIGSMALGQSRLLPASGGLCRRRRAGGAARRRWDQVGVRGRARSTAARSSASTRWRQTVTAQAQASM